MAGETAHPRSRGDHAAPARPQPPPDGSPPLARGPLCLRLGGGQLRRLTPARAGTTGTGPGGTGPGAAHPRSRGDHHRRPRRRRLLDWLTPARAGTTNQRSSGLSDETAHPRSRGDHDGQWPDWARNRGSPPLARGPQGRTHRRAHPGRLTPARAGTTSVRGAMLPALTAHPRSRGDHQWTAPLSPGSCGSPPLARGPRVHFPLPAAVCRLTPARAGTTSWSDVPRTCSAAHPRSRGDHDAIAKQDNSTHGSPPLARGPPGRHRPHRHRRRLTPARAGTTKTRRSTGSVDSAHPRSRGDHPRPGVLAHHQRRLTPARAGTTKTRRSTGSVDSAHPRSRGDHPRPGVLAHHQRRLTPARAGTTVPAGPSRRRSAAHPRSRGDHKLSLTIDGFTRGSPPLARGPRPACSPTWRIRRLTPARAGTTCSMRGTTRAATAHPRSRGDHVHVPGHLHPVVGSPPLARGPRRSCCRSPPGVRLTPARAGTTAPTTPGTCRPTAHPRSRGDHGSRNGPSAPPCGSPPLARGPQSPLTWENPRRRLTPARAGTTPCGRP